VVEHAGARAGRADGDLRTLLQAPESRGVRRWPAGGHSDDIARAASQLGWRVYRLDTRGIDGKRAVIRRFVADLGLPSYTGGNWDALEESLGDLPVAGSAGVVLVWRGWRSFADADPEAMAVASDVLNSVAAEWAAVTGYGVVALVSGRKGARAPDAGDRSAAGIEKA